MKNNTAVKVMDWQRESVANKAETMLGAKIGWREIDEEKGRGVFALRDIKKGEVIEVAPVIPVAKENVVENGEAPDGYLLTWDDEEEGEEYCMPLGYIMMYNHGPAANMDLESNIGDYTITAKASRDIKAGEELTWDYSCDLWWEEEE